MNLIGVIVTGTYYIKYNLFGNKFNLFGVNLTVTN
jgi:hypothetical protein